jgi:XRE family aerobic/anaerobic benzoate catabolism transcriptional regulator
MIGEIVRSKRIRKGFNQVQFASLLGISQTHLSQIELGKKKPSLDLLVIISKALECSINDLIQDDANPLEPVRDTTQ